MFKNESLVSTLLGALIVILVGILAYGYFRTNRPAVTPINTQSQEGEIATPAATVALPATHTVAPGDTLWSISEKYYASGDNYQDIARANNLANPGEIEVGQKLTIPKTDNTALEQTVTPNTISGTGYTVVRGDNLWNIAVRAYGNGFKWVEIAQANKLSNPQIIHAGNVFILPR